MVNNKAFFKSLYKTLIKLFENKLSYMQVDDIKKLISKIIIKFKSFDPKLLVLWI